MSSNNSTTIGRGGGGGDGSSNNGGGGGGGGRRRVMTQPINQIFRFLQTKTVVQIMLYEQTKTRLQGIIIGFDEYMNIVLDEALEISNNNSGSRRKPLGRILLKGDNITLLGPAKT